jgi:hypothetical protein
MMHGNVFWEKINILRSYFYVIHNKNMAAGRNSSCAFGLTAVTKEPSGLGK